MTHTQEPEIGALVQEGEDVRSIDVIGPVGTHWKAILASAVICAALAIGLSFAFKPGYTATNTFLPPQQQGSGAQALASLGALSGLVGSGSAARNSPDQYIALMQSVTISDRIIKRFDLRKEWDVRYEEDARRKLLLAVSFVAGKKDSLIHVSATDTDPKRAAAMANQYVEELRLMTNGIAITEAQQRRVFFERLLEQTRDKLTAAQTTLESSGYSAGALNVEPRSAAEGYAQLRAALTSAEVRLQILRNSLADSAPEVSRQREAVNALGAQVAKLEAEDQAHPHNGDYIGRYREFKYQETLFDLFARQYESARVDESREGALIQVVDPATPPERKSSPKRMYFGAFGALAGLLAATVWFVTDRRRKSVAAAA